MIIIALEYTVSPNLLTSQMIGFGIKVSCKSEGHFATSFNSAGFVVVYFVMTNTRGGKGWPFVDEVLFIPQ